MLIRFSKGQKRSRVVKRLKSKFIKLRKLVDVSPMDHESHDRHTETYTEILGYWVKYRET